VAEGYGLIVGRLRPGPAVDIDDYLGLGLADELALLDFADWEPQSEPHVHRVGASWKVTLDTFRENYHFNYLHRRTPAKYAHGGVPTFDGSGPHLRNCSAVRTIGQLRGRPESEWRVRGAVHGCAPRRFATANVKVRAHSARGVR
jgi:choline monooxygenase